MAFISVSFSPVIYLAFEGAATNKKEITFFLKKNGKKFQSLKEVTEVKQSYDRAVLFQIPHIIRDYRHYPLDKGSYK